MPRCASNVRLRSSSAFCSSGVGASRRGSDMSPCETLDGLAVTTITLPRAPTSVAARSRERSDGGESSYPTTTVPRVRSDIVNRATVARRPTSTWPAGRWPETTTRSSRRRWGGSKADLFIGLVGRCGRQLRFARLFFVHVVQSAPDPSPAQWRRHCTDLGSRRRLGVGVTSGSMVSRPTRCSWWPSSTSRAESTSLGGDAERTGELDQE